MPTSENYTYSNVLSRLEGIVLAMQMPGVLFEGVKFDMKRLTFDKDFSEKLRRLFADRFEEV